MKDKRVKLINKEELRKLFVDEALTLVQMEQRTGISRMTLSKKLRQMHLTTRYIDFSK